MKMCCRYMVSVFLLLLNVSGVAYAIDVIDSRGKHTFEKTPERVIALNWGMAENMLELGVTPLGIADISGYQEWVVYPEIPHTVVNVGLRDQPNIELIAKLKPDLIILSDGQSHLISKMENIAPVLYFESFRSNHDNAAIAKQIFLELAKLFDQTQAAQQRLDTMDENLRNWQSQLSKHFKGDLPPVTAVRFNSPTAVLIYGKNSMPEYTLSRLGFVPAYTSQATRYGVTQHKVTDLSAIQQGIVLHIKPFHQSETLFTTPLWQSMPFVQSKQFAGVEPAWVYGGICSIEYLGQHITKALLSIPR